jgi:hypothetical protein
VYAWRETLLIRDPPKQRRELVTFRLIEGGADGILVLARNATDLLQDITPRPGQVQRVGATVAGAVPTLEDAASLERIEQRDKTAREYTELLAQFLLAQSIGLADHPQDPHLWGRQI